jgi:hypothetical protein
VLGAGHESESGAQRYPCDILPTEFGVLNHRLTLDDERNEMHGITAVR